MGSLHAVAASAVLLSLSPAQTVWNATSPDLTPIFAQAAPGDIVLLSGSNSYVPFTLNKGLTLIGNPGAAIYDSSGIGQRYDSSILVPPGQHAHLVNVNFAFSLLAQSAAGHHVAAAGSVTFDNCSFAGTIETYSNHTENVSVAGDVRMHHCRILNHPSMTTVGLRAFSGFVSLTDCDLVGHPAGWDPFSFPWNATSGLTIVDATVVASRCTMTGGHADWDYNSNQLLPASPGIEIIGSSGELYLSDSTVVGGDGGPSWQTYGPGAAALAVSTVGAARAEFARNSLIGGTGTVNGPATAGNAVLVPELVGIRIDHGFVRGQTTTVTATAGSSQLLLGIFGSLEPGLSTYPLVIEPVLQTAFGVTLATPAAGALVTAPIAIPNVSSLLGVEAWLQALQLTSGPVRASAVVGGVVH
ncbi:MAG: hypothetical protein KDE27_30245 [Planctomycetes bacterium]|nr:hypothetical protein [Planctomycetota bacterium]